MNVKIPYPLVFEAVKKEWMFYGYIMYRSMNIDCSISNMDEAIMRPSLGIIIQVCMETKFIHAH